MHAERDIYNENDEYNAEDDANYNQNNDNKT
jgi:hypothetical protein